MADRICSMCPKVLPPGRELCRCTECNRTYMRQWLAEQLDGNTGATRDFPGVDIDAIHYKRGAIRG